MAILGEIRKRPILLMGIIALALLAFVINPDSLDKVFGKNPSILGKVNGEDITRDEFNDQLFVLQQQAQQQGQPTTGLEEQTWKMLVQSKLIKQQFEKLGFEMNDVFFWSQLQYDPMFAQNQSNFDEKGNFRLQEIKKQIEDLQSSGQVEAYNQWLKTRKSIEYRMMARQVFGNITAGITTGNKEAQELMKERDELADIDFVKVDYTSYLQKNPIKVTKEDLSNYIKQYPNTYKTEPSVNLGIVHFPATPSASDDLASKNQLDKLYLGAGENFQNSPNDSMFVVVNSDLPYNGDYTSPDKLPSAISSWVKTAAVGQTFGPYKEQDYYIVSKLMGKKPSDSTLSRHILIAFEGSPAGKDVKRTKEQAKKLADSIGNIVKANPSKFTEFLNISNDPSSAAQGGSVGWTTPQSPFVPQYLAFLANNSKGSTGVVETQFGYHIINIVDKKSGTMDYKVAHLAKAIKASDATQSNLDKNARRYIQQVQGKSFNDFSNIAKKEKFNFTNPKTIHRFDGAIQGLGTDSDGEVISWAFDKKRKKGDTEFYTVEGTGDKIVVYFNGRQEKGMVDPESIRDQIESLVKNQLAGKKIAEKIKAAKPTSLDQVAKMFAAQKASAQVNMINPQIVGAMEPKVAGAAFGVAKGKLSQPVEGMTGVYVLVKKSETINKQPGDVKQTVQANSQRNSQMFGQSYLNSLENNATIKDYRIEVWDKKQN